MRSAERGGQHTSSPEDSRRMIEQPLADSPGEDRIIVGPKLGKFLEDGQ